MLSRAPRDSLKVHRNVDFLTLETHPPPHVLAWLLTGDWLVKDARVGSPSFLGELSGRGLVTPWFSSELRREVPGQP